MVQLANEQHGQDPPNIQEQLQLATRSQLALAIGATSNKQREEVPGVQHQQTGVSTNKELLQLKFKLALDFNTAAASIVSSIGS